MAAYTYDPRHSADIQAVFPEIEINGVDLWGIIEIKETMNHAWKLQAKDAPARWFLFIGRNPTEYHFVKAGLLRDALERLQTSHCHQTTITELWVVRHASFTTSNPVEARKKAEFIRKVNKSKAT